jgi:hypothetical protein
MSALITINFAGGSATSPGVEIVLTDCEVAPGANAGVTVAMASALTNIAIVGAQVLISTAVGGQFTGSVAIQISWNSGRTPSVTLNNLHNSVSSPAMVTWPTALGPQTQILGPGDPISLSGIIDG